jgi:pimeloyl-ACP methyl ester carboxylesterase
MRTVNSKDGTTIAFEQRGQGPALVVVTGASATRTDAAALGAALASDFAVFAYDRRARGDSGDTAPYAVEREVEDLDAVIDAAGGSAYVFGHSSGAVLALEAARLLPTKIAKLALYEPPFIIDDSRPRMPEGFPSYLHNLVASGRRGDAFESFMALVGAPPTMVAGMRQSPWWPQMEANAQSLVYDAAIMVDSEQGDPAALRKWADVRIPTLVLDGTVIFGRADDHAFLRHGADELARILPNARRRTLEGQDHGPSEAVLAPVLIEFFTAG